MILRVGCTLTGVQKKRGVACVCARWRGFVHLGAFLCFFCVFLCVFACENGLQKSANLRIIVQKYAFYATPPLVITLSACHPQRGKRHVQRHLLASVPFGLELLVLHHSRPQVACLRHPYRHTHSGTEKVPQRTSATKILPNFRVNFLVRFASKVLFYWPVPSNCSENSLVLFVRIFGSGALFWPLTRTCVRPCVAILGH